MEYKRHDFVLIVDDSEMDTFLLSHILTSLNLAEQIKAFDDPALAIDYFRDLINLSLPMPDLIFLDLDMPAMSGFEFLERLNRICEHYPFKCRVVIVSSSDAEEDIRSSSDFPQVVKYLVKPVSKLDFLDL